MTTRKLTFFDTLLYIVWCVFIIGGTAYVVFVLGHSGWWFLLALIILDDTSNIWKT